MKAYFNLLTRKFGSNDILSHFWLVSSGFIPGFKTKERKCSHHHSPLPIFNTFLIYYKQHFTVNFLIFNLYFIICNHPLNTFHERLRVILKVFINLNPHSCKQKRQTNPVFLIFPLLSQLIY